MCVIIVLGPFTRFVFALSSVTGSHSEMMKPNDDGTSVCRPPSVSCAAFDVGVCRGIMLLSGLLVYYGQILLDIKVSHQDLVGE